MPVSQAIPAIPPPPSTSARIWPSSVFGRCPAIILAEYGQGQRALCPSGVPAGVRLAPVHPVMRLISRRHADGSRPGYRSDGHRIALAIEGGSSRGTYSSGMVMALEELGLTRCFDAVYGSSAGALNGAWLL